MPTTLLDKILAPGGVTSYCQPILQVSCESTRIVALELLTRGPANTRFQDPSLLFDYTRRVKAEVLVDKRCIAEGLNACMGLAGDLRIAVNVHASTLERDKAFGQFLQEIAIQNGIVPARLTVEIVEHSPSWSQPEFLKRLHELRELGIKIALDDVGTGHSNYRMILDAAPDYFKIDSYIVRGAHNDPSRRAILRSILCLGEELGAAVVAEGVEYVADLHTLLQIGINQCQGFLFSQPSPTQCFPFALISNQCDFSRVVPGGCDASATRAIGCGRE